MIGIEMATKKPAAKTVKTVKPVKTVNTAKPAGKTASKAASVTHDLPPKVAPPADLIVRTRANRKVVTATDIPGVYRNRAGVMVGEDGVALSFRDLKKRDDERHVEVIGKPVQTPAEFLKSVALDPRMPLHTRVDAANKSAAFFDAKRVAVQGGPVGSPALKMQVAELPKESLDKMEALLEQMQALTGGGQ